MVLKRRPRIAYNATNDATLESFMTSPTIILSFRDEPTAAAGTIFGWLITRVMRRRSNKPRHYGTSRLSDATLSDLGITRGQAEFGESLTRH
jgi:hypothetical protein